MARLLRLVVGLLLASVGVTAVLSLSVLLGIRPVPIAFAGFMACGGLAFSALVIMIVEGVRTA